VVPYEEARQAFEREFCTPRDPHPSGWWNHPVIGPFWIEVRNGEVFEWEFSLIMNDLINNRPPP
jgi:hypothetical protein